MGNSYSWAYKANSGGVHDYDKEKNFGEMKPLKETFTTGQIITLKFFESNDPGKRPIAKHNGVICIIDHRFKQFLAPETTWHCNISRINEKSLIVMPVATVNSLAVNGVIKKKQERKKVKREFQYKSKQELEQ